MPNFKASPAIKEPAFKQPPPQTKPNTLAMSPSSEHNEPASPRLIDVVTATLRLQKRFETKETKLQEMQRMMQIIIEHILRPSM